MKTETPFILILATLLWTNAEARSEYDSYNSDGRPYVPDYTHEPHVPSYSHDQPAAPQEPVRTTNLPPRPISPYLPGSQSTVRSDVVPSAQPEQPIDTAQTFEKEKENDLSLLFVALIPSMLIIGIVGAAINANAGRTREIEHSLEVSATLKHPRERTSRALTFNIRMTMVLCKQCNPNCLPPAVKGAIEGYLTVCLDNMLSGEEAGECQYSTSYLTHRINELAVQSWPLSHTIEIRNAHILGVTPESPENALRVAAGEIIRVRKQNAAEAARRQEWYEAQPKVISKTEIHRSEGDGGTHITYHILMRQKGYEDWTTEHTEFEADYDYDDRAAGD